MVARKTELYRGDRLKCRSRQVIGGYVISLLRMTSQMCTSFTQ